MMQLVSILKVFARTIHEQHTHTHTHFYTFNPEITDHCGLGW